MKLSAPPPPPPPPPEPPAPGEQPPDPTDPTAGTPDAPPPEPPPEPTAPKPMTWPAWYPGVDAALVALVLVFTFAAASFVARNSDVWLHLAAGKRLLAGQYTPGSDPFSYSGADRAWVNHSWLLDAVVALLYGGTGVVLSVAKSLVVVLAFGVLIAIRRPQFPLWPWAAVACVAVLAAAPQFTMRPLVVSILFLSVTMYLVFRMPQKPGTWRLPTAVGVTFWLWANCDQWFFVGPLALLLLLVGDLVQTKLLNGPDEPAAEGAAEEPLGRLPDTAALAKALGVGVLACMLNPHHVRVWELPVELTKPAVMEADPRLRSLLSSPTESRYVNEAGQGRNVNGLAYAALFAAGAVALGFGPGRVRASHIALFVGFAALSLVSVYVIPLFAVVVVPLIAAQLNALSARAELRSWGDPRSRLLFIGSSAGRVACVLAVCALCVIAYPGEVHPDPGSPVYVRRVAWGVEPEPSLVRAGEQFKAWRESGRLPADARGFVTHLDLANYLAWAAPQEKVFVNGRPNHHRPELPDYVAVRKGLGLIEVKDDVPKLSDATDVLRKVGAEYVALYGGPGDGNNLLLNRTGNAASMLYHASNEWSPWYVGGRTAVFGWHAPGAPAAGAFAALRVDPVALAFGPNVEPVQNEPPKPPLQPLGWEEPFIRPPKAAPAGVAEAIGWMRYKEGAAARQSYRQFVREWMLFPLLRTNPHSPAVGWLAFAVSRAEAQGALRLPPTDPDATADAAAVRAAPLLALRAARRAIAADPEHPEPYYALALALSEPALPMTAGERAIGRVAALHQCLIRMPPPEKYKRGQFGVAAFEVARQLADEYLGQRFVLEDSKTKRQVFKGYSGMAVNVAPLDQLLGQTVFENVQNPQAPLERIPFVVARNTQIPSHLRPISGDVPLFLPLDVARETLQTALQYLAADTAADPSGDVKKIAEQLEARRKEVEEALLKANQGYRHAQSLNADRNQLVRSALTGAMPGEALKLLAGGDIEKDFKDGRAQAAVLWVSLEIALGRLEEATNTLETLATPGWGGVLDQFRMTPIVRQLKYLRALYTGEYKAAGEALEGGEGSEIGVDPLLADLAKNKITPHELLFAEFSSWPPATAGTAPGDLAMFRFKLMERANRALQIRDVMATKLRQDSQYFYRRGVLALMEGDIRATKQWFQQSTRKSPPGWSLAPEFFNPDAQRYLRLIEAAEKKPAP